MIRTFLFGILALLSACAAEEDFVQVGDWFVTAVEKEGPIVGINRETCPEGETHVLLSGGFRIAVFRTEDCIGYFPVTTAPVQRVFADWRALPSAER